MNRWGFLGFFLIVFASLYGSGRGEGRAAREPRPFVVAHSLKGETLDPHFSRSPGALRIWRALSDSLVRWDPASSQVRPALAESWEAGPDNMSFLFRLAPRVWDDGSPVTADQVAASWKRALDPALGSPHGWYAAAFLKGGEAFHSGRGPWEDVGLAVLDSRTLRVELSGPYPAFPAALTHRSFAVLPPASAEGGSDWAAPGALRGSGAYRLASWGEEGLLLKKKGGRSSSVSDGPAELLFSEVSGPEEAAAGFAAGRIDWVPPELFPAEGGGEAFSIKGCEAPLRPSCYFYLFNRERPALENPLVRRALSAGIDRELLVSRLLRGRPRAAHSLLPPPWGTRTGGAGPEEARTLLSRAGYPGGRGLPPLTLICLEGEGHRELAEFLAEQWREHLGVRTERLFLPSAAFARRKEAGAFDLALGGVQALYPDPAALLRPFFTGGRAAGRVLSDGELDGLLRDASLAADPERRSEILARAEEVLCGEGALVLPLFFYDAPQLINRSRGDLPLFLIGADPLLWQSPRLPSENAFPTQS